jgi:outer membrane protein assembly factor BamB
VVALRLADGSLAWSGPAAFPTSGPPAGISVGYAGSGAQPGPSGVLPALLQAAVFIAAGQNVTALSAFTGATIWTRSLLETTLQGPPVLSTAASTGSTLYVGGASGRLYAFNSVTGADALAGLATQLSPVTGTLALAGSTLYVPTSGGLTAVDVTTGTVFWTRPFAAGSGVAVAGGSPYVATADGQFVGFH